MLSAEADAWIGKTLFIPPIIKLCHLTRQTQYAVSRLFWFVAALDGFYRAETLFSSVLWGGVSVIMMIGAVRRADAPSPTFMWFRLLAVVMFLLALLKVAVTGEWGGAEFWIFILIAEYAATIRTLPPRDSCRRAVEAPTPR
jgi:surface polysaccharide O-acyltransferase-like enzyme